MKSPEEGIEYSVIAFDIDDGTQEKVLVTANMEDAFRFGKQEIETGDFDKIEVRKKYTDPKNGRVVDMPLKVYHFEEEGGPLPLFVFVLAAVLCGSAAFALTFYLINGDFSGLLP